MGRSYGVVRTALLAAVLLLPSAAAAADGAPEPADKTAAAREFAKGDAAFGAGDYTAAAQAFERAYRLAPHQDPLWNAARAWHLAGEHARAANLYARYLREAPPGSPDRERAVAQLVRLSSKLARIEVHADADDHLTIDGAAADPGTTYVNPGEHVVVARRGSRVMQESVRSAPGSVTSVAFAPESPPGAAPAPAPTPRAPSGSPRVAADGERTASSGRGARTWSPFVVLGEGIVTAAAGAVTVWSGLDTHAARKTFDARPTEDNLDAGRSKETRTNVALAVTAALAATTLATAAFLVDWGGARSEVAVGAGFGAITARASF